MRYRITFIAGILDTTDCPPAIVKAVFPQFAGWPVELNASECLVTVPAGVTPLDISPLVKVEAVG